MTTAWAGVLASSDSRPNADERSQVASRNGRCVGNGAIFCRQLEIGQTRVEGRDAPPQLGAGLEIVGLRVHLQRAFQIAARIEYLADAGSRRSVRRIHFNDPAVSRQRLVGFPLFHLDVCEIAHEESAVRRCDDRLLVHPGRFVQAIRLCRLAGGRDVILQRPRPQHLHSPRDGLQLRIDFQCRLERRERFRFARRREQRFAPPDDGR